MRKIYSIIFFLSIFIFAFFLNTKTQAGSIWLVIDDPQQAPQSGEIFETALKFSTWDAVMGAYLITLHYDPNILQILQITTPSQSEFYSNTFINENSFTSGTTDIAAFQVQNFSEQVTPTTFATIKWKALGSPGTSTTIGLEAKTMIDSFLRPIEINISSITFKINVLNICPDSGIPCVERTDGGDDSNNLVNDMPKVDIEYKFSVIVKDTNGTPQYVKLFMTQRNNPFASDFYGYNMVCSGDYSTGATCTYTTKLGPAAVHKFYIEATMSDGTTITYPDRGHITGPQVQLLTGYNLVGIPRDINGANLNGSQAFGSSTTYRWNASTGYYKLVTNANPVKTGEGYFSLRKNNTLYELINYGDIQANEYTYQLNAGWNIISNPYGGNVKLSDIKVQKGSGTPVTWQEAISAPNGWIANAIYYYKGTDWGGTYDYETSPEATLVPWMGYWVKLNKEDDTYYLVIPKP